MFVDGWKYEEEKIISLTVYVYILLALVIQYLPTNIVCN